MKRSLLAMYVLLVSSAALAGGAEYVMRVDGLACPYCAYGVEKKLKQVDGVHTIDIDLDAGLVTVQVEEGTELTDPQMKRLFNEAGFTFRSMNRHAL